MVITFLSKAREAQEKRDKAISEGLAPAVGGDSEESASEGGDDEDEDEIEFVYDIQVQLPSNRLQAAVESI